MSLINFHAVTVGLLILGSLAGGVMIIPRGPSSAAQAGQPEKPPAREKAADSRSSVDLAKVDRTTRSVPPAQGPVPTVLGPKAFRDGDMVEITDVRATSTKLEPGDTVTVRGRVRLASQNEARLGLYLTQTERRGHEETDPSQTRRVKQGLGEFELKATIKHRGVLHVTLYDEAGKPFGGVYFGTASQMKRIDDWSLDYYLTGEMRQSP